LVLRKNKSAIKKATQAEKKRLRNSHVKSTMKTYIKKVAAAMEGQNKDELAGSLKNAVSYIKKAASKGVIHKNTASRKVSRLSRKAGKLSQSQPKG
jgi:small subunit ribosomal protein S20